MELLTKSSQLEATVNCRDKARLSNKKVKDLKKQVARAMNSKGSTLHRSNYLSEGYEDYEETDEGPIGSQHDLMCEASVNFNGSSRAEETLRNEIYKKRKREHLPEGYQQQFITKNSV
jgi:hypothetical protein